MLKYFEEHRIFVCLIGIGKYFNEIASDNRKVLRGSAGMKELIDYVADVSEMTGTELEFLRGLNRRFRWNIAWRPVIIRRDWGGNAHETFI